ncbi:hypothetical protein [Actinokineospora bangkokensis]|uniref:Uncharacterized protein n=1 Tax=Actinokineospora bangkokensis TaxID=1193682 RepID=A0A1Q9LQV9_9PSEU|nr:hypothetical protein [Actinokineospora bangkokensis]OLR94408.1 hypothetical protein BJP25_11650 [Actinokineospora bangkokensis]
MQDAVYVDYQESGGGWVVTVKHDGEELVDRADGDLVSARDCANTLIATLAAVHGHRPVVHLLDGDAVAYSAAYLSERAGLPWKREDPAETPAVEPAEAAGEPTQPDQPPAEPDHPAPPVQAEEAGDATEEQAV